MLPTSSTSAESLPALLEDQHLRYVPDYTFKHPASPTKDRVDLYDMAFWAMQIRKRYTENDPQKVDEFKEEFSRLLDEIPVTVKPKICKEILLQMNPMNASPSSHTSKRERSHSQSPYQNRSYGLSPTGKRINLQSSPKDYEIPKTIHLSRNPMPAYAVSTYAGDTPKRSYSESPPRDYKMVKRHHSPKQIRVYEYVNDPNYELSAPQTSAHSQNWNTLGSPMSSPKQSPYWDRLGSPIFSTPNRQNRISQIRHGSSILSPPQSPQWGSPIVSTPRRVMSPSRDREALCRRLFD